MAEEGAALRGSGRLKDSWAWRCRAGLSRDHAIRTQDRTPSEWGARTVNAGRPSRGATYSPEMVGRRDATRRTMARAVPVAPVGAVLQWERCSSGSDALVGAMLRWEPCSSGSGGRSDDSVVERSTRARDRKAAVRGSRHCGRGDAGRVDLSMPLTHVPSPVCIIP